MIGKTKRYNDGDRVCAVIRPQVPLTVRIYANKVYYCNVEGDDKAKEQVYFERELKLYVK
ncbi:hypothetical protein NBRC110019_29460 [Neptunitalea chrysea]|uniref:Uncharacterized protein n=1 Tax=Neptunitalea chrysea TaxID=1647581 RepID=A0A9W6B7C2_9FLAO|nr:hypothetical protein NBRC110019_29460 [Neptunitalea chrysea]